MIPPRLETVEEIFHAALDCAPDQLSAFLEKKCAGDESLRSQVEQLLAAHQQRGSFIEGPVAALAASVVASGQTNCSVGQAISNYEILGEIGRGGMGVIYRARQRYSRRIVALKRVLTYQADSHETLERFRREAEAAASLDHPNILPIHEVGQGEDGLPFFSMKYAAGGSLQKAGPALRNEPRECVRLMAKVARAVQFAHERGILHRDLKPGNILLDADGEPFVSDFGLAKWLDTSTDLTRTLTIFGTPGYIAPEQAKGPAATLTPAADVYSLGAILFDLFTGRPPFLGEHALVVIQQASEKPAPKLRSLAPALDRDLETICTRCLEREPQARYRSAGDLAIDLECWLEGRPIIARRVSTPVRVWRWSKRNPTLAAATIVAFCSAAAAAFLFVAHYGVPRRPPAASTLATPSAHVKTMAVLPLKVLGADSADEYLGVGLADALVTQIGRIPQIVVRPTAAVQKSAEMHGQDPLATGRELRVEAVLEGTAQRVDDDLRVTCRLLRVRDGAVLWSGKLDKKFADVFAIQDSISQEVAKALIQNLSEEDRKLLTERHTDNLEAFRAYLKGRYFWNKRTVAGLQQSLQYFRQAIDLDPTYASAYAGLADSYALGVWQEALPQKEYIPRAKAAAIRALEIDETLGEPHASLGFVKLWYEWDFAGAESELRRAIELSPNYATAHHWYGEFLMLMGRFEEGLKELRLAQEADPLSVIINSDLGKLFYFARQMDQAIEQLQKTIELDSQFPVAHLFLAMAYQKKGMIDEAIAQLQKEASIPSSRTVFQFVLAYIYAQAGNSAEAQRILQELQTVKSPAQFVPAFGIALIYVGLGEKEQAIEWLEKAVAEREPFLIYLKVDPNFDSLRDHPRFASLLRRIGFTVGVMFWERQSPPPLPTKTAAIPYKSIAVLPFQNLSADPENAFFTDAMQDEILNHLAKIADLKVISRTSVMQYTSGVKRNLRQIANELGVAHVVEGSVQRADNRLRVSAQLIDARNDAHLWAQTYDRDLADVFAIQSEIAKAIADQLQAKLSPGEQNAIEQPPTIDVTAFDLYSRARALILSMSLSHVAPRKALDAADLLNQATARDPSFFLAYCELARTHDYLYLLGNDHTPARLALAEAAIDAAFRLRPDAGEAHLARAWNLYCGYLDYDGALRELEVARPTLPNNPLVFELAGYILRRRGQHEEGLRNLQRAIQLAPRNIFTLQQIAYSYLLLRRYPEEAAALDRALAVDPNDVTSRASRALVELDWKADTGPLHQAMESIRAENTAAIKEVADRWFICALAERDARSAEIALAAGENSIRSDAVFLSLSFGQGLIGRMANDESKARAAFSLARAQQEKIVQAQPQYGPALCVLGLIDAGLGRREDALREGRRAVDLMPIEKDSVNGAHMIEYFAITAAWAGEKDLALEQLASAIRNAGTLSYGQLKLLPYWDPLRGDPRFEKIVASLAPN
jgi:serine/threonine-protein kinase